MKTIGLTAVDEALPGSDSTLLTGWLDRAELARELTLSVDTLQRWEVRKAGAVRAVAGRR